MNFKLALTNLLISQFFIMAFLLFAYLVWYPHSLSEFIDFSHNAQLIILVNIVLGPMLLLLVYKKQKKTLKFDLSVLLILQLLAIFYGAYSLYQKHPSYAVFTVDRFTIIQKANSEPEKIQFEKLKPSLFSSTKLAFAKFPDEIHKKNELVLSTMLNPNNDLDKRHEYFEPLENHISHIAKKSINTNTLFSNDIDKIKLNKFLNKHSGQKDDYLYLPLQSASKDVVWVLDKITAQPVGIIDIDPWL